MLAMHLGAALVMAWWLRRGERCLVGRGRAHGCGHRRGRWAVPAGPLDEQSAAADRRRVDATTPGSGVPVWLAEDRRRASFPSSPRNPPGRPHRPAVSFRRPVGSRGIHLCTCPSIARAGASCTARTGVLHACSSTARAVQPAVPPSMSTPRGRRDASASALTVCRSGRLRIAPGRRRPRSGVRWLIVGRVRRRPPRPAGHVDRVRPPHPRSDPAPAVRRRWPRCSTAI